MFRIIQNITIPNISRTVTQGSRMSLPVDPALLMYSHFEHVYGRAAPHGTQGVAISQLRVLDVLIGRLAQVRGEALPPPLLTAQEENPAAAALLDALQIDALGDSAQVEALIADYRTQILQSMEASAAMPYLPAPNAQSGAVINVVA